MSLSTASRASRLPWISLRIAVLKMDAFRVSSEDWAYFPDRKRSPSWLSSSGIL